MLDAHIQRELQNHTLDPDRALIIAVNTEMGHKNPQEISANNTNGVNEHQKITRFRSAKAQPH